MGHLTSLTYPSSRAVSFAPNAFGQATQAGTYATLAQYYPTGQLKQFNYGNGQAFHQTLDDKMRPYTRVVSKSGNVLSQTYLYDANDNIETITDNIIATNSLDLGYDNLDRLTSATGFWGSGSFGYDELGNIESKTLGSEQLTYNYGTNNRLNSVTGSLNRSFSYDSRGNVENNGQRGFVFNRANRLASSGTVSYSYDGHGRRVLKNNNGAKTYSLYNSQGVLMSTYESGGYTDYFYLGSQLVAKYNDPNTQSDKPGYTGHVEDDDLQLTYMQQRYYDPIIGRFYSNDPMGFKASNPMMFNRYAYANNNPYKFVDPDGRVVVLAIPYVIEGAVIARNAYTAYRAARALQNIIQSTNAANESADPIDQLVDELKGDKVSAPGKEGDRGGLLGTPEQADADWDKIKSTEGAELKDENNVKLPGGRHANRHTSSRPYPDGVPAGTDTIKIYKPGARVPEYTARYPEVKKK
ncbi:RHS repeat-associated core domain-containing protein [Arsukibacterium sp.]|uniref:RHS repeat domain-containing protein n=1 Tax=Arsukibacterium sp. TaxID=1977258 RepID=UPI00299D3C67|nr:RHS repeat-associated core domain-containing protein [Arsukibacterium sp.]MDX1536650.1 RHS repeat-associated core domain-containing protein [Arsukibacterium sp.]